MARTATVSRSTKETTIELSIDLDGTGKSDISTGIGFFDHMLTQIARHGLVDLKVSCRGDLEVDGHHTVEDVGLAFGQALAEALGDKRGICRYGSACVPLDEALSRVVIDLSGRPYLVFEADFTRHMCGEFDTELVREFFQAVASRSASTLHVDNLRGLNAHHQCESIFKAFARALRMAVEADPRMLGQIPSSKGTL